MTKMTDANAISYYIKEINSGLVRSGMYFGVDEVVYCQAKYNRALDLARQYGELEFYERLLSSVDLDKLVPLDPYDARNWRPLWAVIYQLQNCTIKDVEGLQLDSYDTFVAEVFMLIAVFHAGAEHC